MYNLNCIYNAQMLLSGDSPRWLKLMFREVHSCCSCCHCCIYRRLWFAAREQRAGQAVCYGRARPCSRENYSFKVDAIVKPSIGTVIKRIHFCYTAKNVSCLQVAPMAAIVTNNLTMSDQSVPTLAVVTLPSALALSALPVASEQLTNFARANHWDNNSSRGTCWNAGATIASSVVDRTIEPWVGPHMYAELQTNKQTGKHNSIWFFWLLRLRSVSKGKKQFLPCCCRQRESRRVLPSSLSLSLWLLRLCLSPPLLLTCKPSHPTASACRPTCTRPAVGLSVAESELSRPFYILTNHTLAPNVYIYIYFLNMCVKIRVPGNKFMFHSLVDLLAFFDRCRWLPGAVSTRASQRYLQQWEVADQKTTTSVARLLVRGM